MDESDRRLQDEIRTRLRDLDRLLEPGKRAAKAFGDATVPAWRQVTEVESRVAVSVALIVAIVLMSVLPARIANHPRWLLPVLAGILFVIVLAVNPMRTDARSRRLRPFAFALLAVLSLGNAASAMRLIVDLVRGEGLRDPAVLLLTGAAVWTTNMILFAVWYWEFDRGGPFALFAIIFSKLLLTGPGGLSIYPPLFCRIRDRYRGRDREIKSYASPRCAS